MVIDLLYFEGCPNHGPTLQLVCDVVQDLAVNAIVREVEVTGPEVASRLRFFGSPTIQIDGVDIDPSVRSHADYSFSCRTYGKTGMPPRELIERAIREGLGA